MPVKIDVNYGAKQLTIAPGESKTVSAYTGAQHFRVATDSKCRRYDDPFSRLSGNYYEPGFRHTLSLTIRGDLELVINANSEFGAGALTVDGRPCNG